MCYTSAFRTKLSAHREGMEILSGGEHALASKLPRGPSGNKETGSLAAKENLKKLMHEVRRQMTII